MSGTPNRDMPAFASLAIDPGGDLYGAYGLTKREYFAGLALQGLLAAGMPATAAADLSIQATRQLLAKLEAWEQADREFAEVLAK